MTKPFLEALADGFKHIMQLSDPEQISRLRNEGVLIDNAGYHSFSFGDKKEFELAIEPIGDEGYLVSLYKNKIRITEPLPMKPL